LIIKEKKLLLSYPRSGNTFLRYCIEYVTKIPTIGYRQNNVANPNKKGDIDNPINNNCDINLEINYNQHKKWLYIKTNYK
jgi:hypothetical protein